MIPPTPDSTMLFNGRQKNERAGHRQRGFVSSHRQKLFHRNNTVFASFIIQPGEPGYFHSIITMYLCNNCKFALCELITQLLIITHAFVIQDGYKVSPIQLLALSVDINPVAI